jgi:hypothetical protein
MATEAIALARRFEPILYFHRDEQFFPSDAKRYIEHCALWKAEAPFDQKDSWGGKGRPFPRQPLIAHKKIAASNATGEMPPGSRYLGEQQPGGAFRFLVHNEQEDRFFELAGWKDAKAVDGITQNRYANTGSTLADLYNTDVEPGLRNSRFWYHAELFNTDRLSQLMVSEKPARLPDLGPVFKKLEPRRPSLLCYYFFFPAHKESLAAPCDANETGANFGDFAGEWACMALLLERPNPNQPHRPLWIGHTGRRIGGGAIQAFDDERRVGMSVHSWQDKTDVHAELLPHTIDEHPKLYVSLGTHSLYLQPGTHSVKAYPPEAYPYWCGQFDSPAALEQYLQSLPPPPAKSNPNPLIGLAKSVSKKVPDGPSDGPSAGASPRDSSPGSSRSHTRPPARSGGRGPTSRRSARPSTALGGAGSPGCPRAAGPWPGGLSARAATPTPTRSGRRHPRDRPRSVASGSMDVGAARATTSPPRGRARGPP